MNSRMSGPPVASRSTRRSATVTISVPLASSASRIASPDENFPVPTMRRDANARPAMTRGSSMRCERPPVPVATSPPSAGVIRIRFFGSPPASGSLSARCPELPAYAVFPMDYTPPRGRRVRPSGFDVDEVEAAEELLGPVQLGRHERDVGRALRVVLREQEE